ncbi:FAD-dependent oxidoreductase [Sulfolobus tengchongensis]|uniref:FAD-dependent oxidoreductase n=1 Tax=Sulfolobus tengchongensis TaxID=207809 RepID=A0AAX4L0D3_9CREN
MKVGIVGGGIVGLFTAYYLTREGIKDLVIYEKSFPGAGSIHAAGLIEPYRFDRINTINMVKKMLKYKINGATDIKEVDKLWLTELIKNLEKNPPQDAWDTLREMARFSLSEYKRLAEEKNDFDYHEDGLLELYYSHRELEKGIEEERKSPFNPKFEVMEVEGFAGGIFFPELSRISTEKFINRIIREIESNVTIVNKMVNKISEDGYINDEKYDVIVVASGIWSRYLKVPITAFKGYGYRVRGVSKLKQASVIVDYGLAISPLSDHIKITGGFDADFSNDSIRAEGFLKRAEKIVDIYYVYDLNIGFRPCSPDGFPIIGRKNNVVLATGACRLGWSYGPAIGKYASDFALSKVTDLGYISRYYHQ